MAQNILQWSESKCKPERQKQAQYGVRLRDCRERERFARIQGKHRKSLKKALILCGSAFGLNFSPISSNINSPLYYQTHIHMHVLDLHSLTGWGCVKISCTFCIIAGPRCPWGPVYGSRCLYSSTYIQELWLRLCSCDSGWWWYQLNTIVYHY